MPARTDSRRRLPASAHPATAKAGRKARAVLDRPSVQGWKTSDDDEIALRRWRGATEVAALEPLEPEHPLFGTFRAQSGGNGGNGRSGGGYEVEIRSLDGFVNSCGCIDHRVNGLGTCKHIEGALAALGRRRGFRAQSAAGNPRIEIFLDRRGEPRPAVASPAGKGLEATRRWLAPFLEADGTLAADPAKVQALFSAWHVAPAGIRDRVRVSRHFAPWLERHRRERERGAARAKLLAEVAAGRASLDLLKHPLLPYQREGMLHLAFTERALLADEMGLGKTVQAIAACELLAQRKDIGRVLVVCPASLKAEWEEQIARFTARGTRVVFGPRAARLAQYREPAFFTIVNYEQVLSDAADLNQVLRPDVIVLDEAQRIKNWQTKTARQVKTLRAPYAFVLTGTPVENRIDELYSIVQYLDPELVGPLFRFNRDFYELDERGRPVDYKNLADLRARLGRVMLRRRKADVESELPGRTVKNYFVPMADEQRARYQDYARKATPLIQLAQRRPLLPAEFEQLMMYLACMRMICDTPAILDPTCRISPKLEELEGVLGDLLAEPDRKIIVFSEWERMLAMVRELAGEMGVEAAWHTGSVPQQRRRAEITRFKEDPACRLFLSTDSGSVGLNLQCASAVVNVDLPWNPAKLEQRIARAWRKNQTRSVTVVNLVCEDSIEHQMLGLLGRKQALADGVLDGQGDLDALTMPSGRAAMIERMQALMQVKAPPPVRVLSAEEALAEDLKARHGARVLLIEARNGGDGRVRVLAVLDLDGEGIAAEATRHSAQHAAQPAGAGIVLDVVDRGSWLAMQRLAASGMIVLAQGEARVLHRAAELDAPASNVPSDQRARAHGLRAEADRALRMARVLAAGGFAEEALPLLAKAVGIAAAAVLAVRGELAPGATSATPEQVRELVEQEVLPPQAEEVLAGVWSAPRAAPAALAELAAQVLATAATPEQMQAA